MDLLDRFAARILHAATRAAKARNSGSNNTGVVRVPDVMLAKPRPPVDADTVPLPPCRVQGRYVPRTNTARHDDSTRNRSTRWAVPL
ncbi:hypothetical protein [Micromonospora carbonacea]|uniref:Uncharacterized protein n=1 Tax=Micromonospora carbonacea TaxID=47853 RepID=A0A1C5AD22_9ACTN|nr:hypothetical protein [Micromonospora carbonacea]SCF43152.1 hypothetical protein GA0070563_112195 [Micromonospora carbonacea]